VDTVERAAPCQMLVNDLVIWENVCNLRCSYCKISFKEFRRVGESIFIGDSKFSVNKLLDDIENLANNLREVAFTPILKLSGGEVTLFSEFPILLERLEKHYDIMQVLTNNISTNLAFFESVSKIKNLHLQISLDGHTSEMSFYRFLGDTLHKKALENLSATKEFGFPLEINCVLTNLNTKNIFEFVDYLSNLNRPLILNLFPVRGSVRTSFFPNRSDAEGILRIINKYADYEHILPPVAYLERLYDFIQTGVRPWSCGIPFAVMGSYGEGDVNICTCSRNLPTLGNVFLDGKNKIRKKIHDPNLYGSFLRKSSHTDCKDCYIHYDVINLYLEGTITWRDLSKMPFYKHPNVKKQLDLLSNIIKSVAFHN
jgi:MoaA/NifB/PqqE/SkfB family radical SAM enzyme